jgi:phage shock protein A
MQARAGAIDELLASGALEDHVSGPQDAIQAELDKLGAGNEIESELARMKGELSAGAPLQIEANGNKESSGSEPTTEPESAETSQAAERPQAGEGS